MVIQSLNHLSGITKIPKDNIKEIKNNLDKFYDFFYKDKIDYVTGAKVLEKGEIKKRPIHPSKGTLKLLQQRLSKFLELNHNVSNSAHGGVKGRSCISFILPHSGNSHFFCTDLEKFFPTVTINHVKDTFLRLGYSRRMASDLAKLTTYSCPVKGLSDGIVIPQGSPTSTIITNLVFYDIDLKIEAHCKEHNVRYTRYVDDLMFSAKFEFTADFINPLVGIITTSGFRISKKKTNSRIGVVEAVGICLTPKGLKLTRKQKEKIKFLQDHPEDKRSKNLKFLEEDYLNLIKKSYTAYIKTLNSPMLSDDDSLGKLKDTVHFPKKLAKANKILNEVGLPKAKIKKGA